MRKSWIALAASLATACATKSCEEVETELPAGWAEKPDDVDPEVRELAHCLEVGLCAGER